MLSKIIIYGISLTIKRLLSLRKFLHGYLLFLFLGTTIGFFYLLFRINQQGLFLGSPIGSELIPLSLFGVLPYIVFYLIWQNNLISWFNIVENYQKRKLEGK